MMVACLYDPAVFLTDDECKEKYNMEVNVQSEVEKPELYMLAQCQSNDNQLLCSEEQVEDLLEINTSITSSNGVVINDVMRIFKGDDPAAQLGAGHLKGGGYFCWLCPIEAAAMKNIILSLKNHFCPYKTGFQRFCHLEPTAVFLMETLNYFLCCQKLK